MLKYSAKVKSCIKLNSVDFIDIYSDTELNNTEIHNKVLDKFKQNYMEPEDELVEFNILEIYKPNIEIGFKVTLNFEDSDFSFIVITKVKSKDYNKEDINKQIEQKITEVLFELNKPNYKSKTITQLDNPRLYRIRVI